MRKRLSRFLQIPVPLYILLLVMLALPTTYLVSNHSKSIGKNKNSGLTQEQDTNLSVHVIRLQDTGLIKPLLFVETNMDNPALQATKNEINEYIARMKKEGIIYTASVYLKDLNNSYSFVINPDEYYDPASMTKVALMLYMLYLEEQNPGILEQKILYSERKITDYAPTIKSKTIELGKKYSFKELLSYMVSYSDNEAMYLIGSRIAMGDFIQFLNYFEIPMVTDNVQRTYNNGNFIVNVNSMSRFFRVLYNSTFLSRQHSQFALELLAQCDYKMGIQRELPQNIKVAHKFGERFESGVAQFHEFGIVYLNNKPYLLGVMTKGANLTQLPDVIANISKIAYIGMQQSGSTISNK